ncbi:uncharacterized protein BDZ99DRAFT_215519 [Mytilinidion resinicola]|uniref:Secreted protein n=1 Tax=Mytilinidion resinicola TaxID=574789 RepID=A0A6A6Y0D9_9PEZI|nr:uncharacterized protein BDZ99DRAFT_215519 [Mytilinidion resinicola]KAF2801685.1 hypothetical protein BDZ99DRAFT_215519 [Mytilinidion resinicola]
MTADVLLGLVLSSLLVPFSRDVNIARPISPSWLTPPSAWSYSGRLRPHCVPLISADVLSRSKNGQATRVTQQRRGRNPSCCRRRRLPKACRHRRELTMRRHKHEGLIQI